MLSVLIEAKDVNQRAQTNMGDQNQGIEKNLLTNQTWRKMTLSDIWYKIEEKKITNLKMTMILSIQQKILRMLSFLV